MHLNHPVFEKYTFDDRVKKLAKQLGLKKPAVLQSLFIFKNPKVGSKGMFDTINYKQKIWRRTISCHFPLVKQHQDSMYFITDPINVLGYWIPIEDATLNNSCLWFIKGSHKMGLLNR